MNGDGAAAGAEGSGGRGSGGSGWDCHAHLFGPYARHPLAAERSYTPPAAPLPAYRALLDRLGLAHGVLVHPSAYGDDHALLFEALAADARLRGVVVVRDGAPVDLAGWRAKGVRGARFSHRGGQGNFAGSASLSDLIALAPRLADAGLHAELWTDTTLLPDIADTLRRLPVPVVVDHMGGFDLTAGIDAPGFRTLRALLADGAIRVKLCAYRNLLAAPGVVLAPAQAEGGRPFHRALLAANPDALVWGSDWPHLRIDPAPDAAAWLATFHRWTDDVALAARILDANPRVLYD